MNFKNELQMIINERNEAVKMLAEWCVAIDKNGAGWDSWDEHYKKARHHPCLIRDLLDDEISYFTEMYADE